MESATQYSDNDLWRAIYDVNSKMSASGIFSKIDALADVFADFLKHGDEFYDYVEMEPKEGEDGDDLVVLLIDSYITQLYLNVPAMILFFRWQEPEFLEYVKDRLVPELAARLPEVTDIDQKTRYRIYGSEMPDKMNDVYLTLRYCRYVVENLDELVHSDEDPLELLRRNDDYRRVSLPQKREGLLIDRYDKMRETMEEIREDIEKMIVGVQAGNMQSDKLVWLGTSTELAYMFEQLAYRGYIENPQTKDGEMNKTALAREVWAHIAPRDVKEETFVVDLRGSRLSESSAFAKAMNAIPGNAKNK